MALKVLKMFEIFLIVLYLQNFLTTYFYSLKQKTT